MKNNETEFLVTDIKELSGRRRLVVINYEPAFAVYTSELKKFDIHKDNIISVGTYNTLLTEVLNKRAAARAMNLLKSRDYARQELIDRLSKDYYPESSVSYALDYVEHYGYINDYRYAQNYLQFKGTAKSQKQITVYLHKKGIAPDIIEQVCDEYYGQSEDVQLNLIVGQMRKKASQIQDFSYENKIKLMAYFYRKGFEADTIKKALDIVVDESDGY